MSLYPLTFDASTVSNMDELTWKSFGKEEIYVGIPPEFGGDEEGCSPEHLYALALLNCYVATFKVIAKNSNLHYDKIEAFAKLTMDKDEGMGAWMKHISFTVKLTKPSHKERAEFLLKKTESACYIHNSVKTEREFNYEVIMI